MSDGVTGRAPFIVLEGVEGAGKTTQVLRLAGWLEELGVPHVTTREPGGTPVGEAIRSVVLDRTDLDVPPVSEMLLILAARAAFVRDIVQPAIEAGRLVLADRYSLSTLAYQGYGRGLDLDDVRRAVRTATGGLRPDLYLLLDVPLEVGVERRKREGRSPDRVEREGADFFERVRAGYLAEARRDETVVRIDAVGTPEEVAARVKEVVTASFPETFGDVRA